MVLALSLTVVWVGALVVAWAGARPVLIILILTMVGGRALVFVMAGALVLALIAGTMVGNGIAGSNAKEISGEEGSN